MGMSAAWMARTTKPSLQAADPLWPLPLSRSLVTLPGPASQPEKGFNTPAMADILDLSRSLGYLLQRAAGQELGAGPEARGWGAVTARMLWLMAHATSPLLAHTLVLMVHSTSRCCRHRRHSPCRDDLVLPNVAGIAQTQPAILAHV